MIYDQALVQHIKNKQNYLESLKISLHELAELHGILCFGVYESIPDISPPSRLKGASEEDWARALASGDTFTDPKYKPTPEKLQILQKMFKSIATSFQWYPISNFFKNDEYFLFNNFCPAQQVVRSKGYSHILDAISCLASQPGLVIRLFNYTEINPQGVYSVWLNINGTWRNYLVDQHVPLYTNPQGKNHFFFTTPDPVRSEIWYCILEKALARAYKGYGRLYGGSQSNILKDLTGSVTVDYPICFLEKNQVINQSERKHISDLWTRVNKNLSKGFILYLSPRPPFEDETELSKQQGVFNAPSHLHEGIYSCHNYSVINVKEVIDPATDSMTKLFKLRNPWGNEKWTGKFSNSNIDPSLKKELRINNEDSSHIWMEITDVMHYFEKLYVCKTEAGVFHNSVNIEVSRLRINRNVIRVSIPQRGKYVFSVDQKDRHFFLSKKYSYSAVKVTLGRLEDDKFEILAHTSTTQKRNTFIRKRVEAGEYVVLIEKIHPPQNFELEKKHPQAFARWRDYCFNLTGPHSGGIKLAEGGGQSMIHDFLLYMNWKSYAYKRKGTLIQQLKVVVGSKGKTCPVELGRLEIPNSMIYYLKNHSEWNLSVKVQFEQIPNTEILGENGSISLKQNFYLEKGGFNVFVLRETLKIEPGHERSSHFAVKSIKGSRVGPQNDSSQKQKIYQFLFKHRSSIPKCMVEEIPELRISSLVDSKSGRIIQARDKPIKETRKSYVVRKSNAKSRSGRSSILAEDLSSRRRISTRRDSLMTRDLNTSIKSKGGRSASANLRGVGDTRSTRTSVPRPGKKKASTKSDVKMKATTKKKVLVVNDELVKKYKALPSDSLLELDKDILLQLMEFKGVDFFLTEFRVDDSLLKEIFGKMQKPSASTTPDHNGNYKRSKSMTPKATLVSSQQIIQQPEKVKDTIIMSPDSKNFKGFNQTSRRVLAYGEESESKASYSRQKRSPSAPRFIRDNSSLKKARNERLSSPPSQMVGRSPQRIQNQKQMEMKEQRPRERMYEMDNHTNNRKNSQEKSQKRQQQQYKKPVLEEIKYSDRLLSNRDIQNGENRYPQHQNKYNSWNKNSNNMNTNSFQRFESESGYPVNNKENVRVKKPKINPVKLTQETLIQPRNWNNNPQAASSQYFNTNKRRMTENNPYIQAPIQVMNASQSSWNTRSRMSASNKISNRDFYHQHKQKPIYCKNYSNEPQNDNPYYGNSQNQQRVDHSSRRHSQFNDENRRSRSNNRTQAQPSFHNKNDYNSSQRDLKLSSSRYGSNMSSQGFRGTANGFRRDHSDYQSSHSPISRRQTYY